MKAYTAVAFNLPVTAGWDGLPTAVGGMGESKEHVGAPPRRRRKHADPLDSQNGERTVTSRQESCRNHGFGHISGSSLGVGVFVPGVTRSSRRDGIGPGNGFGDLVGYMDIGLVDRFWNREANASCIAI